MKKIKKIFIANRGEIAQRILNTAHAMNIRVVVPYTLLDGDLSYVEHADQRVLLTSDVLSESYLNAELMVQLAVKSGADAVHPGYGFLSENSHFASLCVQNGLTWIGPSVEVIQLLGNKQKAIDLAKSLEVPTLNGRFGSAEALQLELKKDDLPLMIKAAAGGGGKGMRIVKNMQELGEALEKASREALNLFGSGTIFVERFIAKARHIEVQVLGDSAGNIIHLFDRECSAQRRFQKLIEEAPAPGLSHELRQKLYNAALKICHFVGYEGVGTVEFLVDEKERFYFLEMNTRIQVEHPVTEEITGVDLVQQQIKVASGETLSIKQNDLKIHGHAIECRICAEDPEKQFLPSPGLIKHIQFPIEDALRVETAINSPQNLSPRYDPMIAKIIVHENCRSAAVEKMQSALQNIIIDGVATNSMFLHELIISALFAKHQIHTSYIDTHANDLISSLNLRKQKWQQVVACAFIALQICNDEGSKTQNHSVWKQIGYWRALPQFNLTIEHQKLSATVSVIHKNAASVTIHDEVITFSDAVVESHKVEFVINTVKHVFYRLAGGAKNERLQYCGHIFNAIESHYVNEKISAKNSPLAQMGDVEIKSVLPGKVVKVNVKEGAKVRLGDTLAVLESMKIENNIASTANGVVYKLNITEGQQLNQNEVLLIIKDN